MPVLCMPIFYKRLCLQNEIQPVFLIVYNTCTHTPHAYNVFVGVADFYRQLKDRKSYLCHNNTNKLIISPFPAFYLDQFFHRPQPLSILFISMFLLTRLLPHVTLIFKKKKKIPLFKPCRPIPSRNSPLPVSLHTQTLVHSLKCCPLYLPVSLHTHTWVFAKVLSTYFSLESLCFFKQSLQEVRNRFADLEPSS